MPETKRRVQTTAAQAAALRDTKQDFDDVTVLFAPPRELLEQTAARDDEVTTFHLPPRSSWSAEDEATVAIRSSFALTALEPLPAPQPLETRPAAPPARMPVPGASMPVPPVRMPTPPARMPTPPATLRPRSAPVEIGDDELGAILGPRRAARWLALGGVLALVLAIWAFARLAP